MKFNWFEVQKPSIICTGLLMDLDLNENEIQYRLTREITLRHWFSSVNLMHIFRTPFTKNVSGRLPREESEMGQV